jgi:hypothetical protein
MRFITDKCVNNDSDKSVTADKTELEQFAGSESSPDVIRIFMTAILKRLTT